MSAHSAAQPGGPPYAKKLSTHRIRQARPDHPMTAFFEHLCGPGVRLMQTLRLPVKFAIISAAFMVPLCVAVYGALSYANGNIALVQQQRLSASFNTPM